MSLGIYTNSCPIELGFAERVMELTALDVAMLAIHPDARYYWCGGDPSATGYDPMPCACCGCANFAVLGMKLTYQDWAAWVETHPKPTDLVGYVLLIDAWESGHREAWMRWLERERKPTNAMILRDKLAKYRKAKGL